MLSFLFWLIGIDEGLERMVRRWEKDSLDPFM